MNSENAKKKIASNIFKVKKLSILSPHIFINLLQCLFTFFHVLLAYLPGYDGKHLFFKT